MVGCVRVPLSDKYILARKDALVHSAKDIAPAKHVSDAIRIAVARILSHDAEMVCASCIARHHDLLSDIESGYAALPLAEKPTCGSGHG